VRANALKTFSSLSGFLDVTDYASPITAFCSGAHSLSRHKRDRSLHPYGICCVMENPESFFLKHATLHLQHVYQLSPGNCFPTNYP
jgi:hypothetical protein